MYRDLLQAADVGAFFERDGQYAARLAQLIEPAYPAHGKGYRAGYSFQNLIEMVVIDRLIGLRVPHKRIQEYLLSLRQSHGQWLADNDVGGWIVLTHDWRWGAGTSLDIAMRSVAHSAGVDTAIVIHIGAIKTAAHNFIDGRTTWMKP
jgi:hypothetical protein